MLKVFVSIILSFYIILLTGMSAHSEESRPCSREIAKFCKKTKPGGGEIINCLKGHEKELSATCRKKIKETGKRLEECQQACCDDVKKFCEVIRPGRGRIAKCLERHLDELSAPCRDKIVTK
jgi:hypothetical protein